MGGSFGGQAGWKRKELAAVRGDGSQSLFCIQEGGGYMTIRYDQMVGVG